MLMCEFLTAVHHKLPVKVVIYNNSAFGLIPLEAESIGLPPFEQGIQFPNPDFAALRTRLRRPAASRRPSRPSCGRRSARRSPADGPAIVDAVVAADEMPNLPHLDLAQLGHFAVAKIREAVLAVTHG